MNIDFYNKIIKSNAGTDSRNKLKNLVLENSELLADVIKIATNILEKNHYKAVWIIELIAESNCNLLQPFMENIISNLSFYKHQSAVRGIARSVYFISVSDKIKLSDFQKNLIIEYCFDGLIGDEKIAPKVSKMYILSYFGKNNSWINEELKTIIEKDFVNQSAGYKTAAKEVLRRIKKNII